MQCQYDCILPINRAHKRNQGLYLTLLMNSFCVEFSRQQSRFNNSEGRTVLKKWMTLLLWLNFFWCFLSDVGSQTGDSQWFVFLLKRNVIWLSYILLTEFSKSLSPSLHSSHMLLLQLSKKNTKLIILHLFNCFCSKFNPALYYLDF